MSCLGVRWDACTDDGNVHMCHRHGNFHPSLNVNPSPLTCSNVFTYDQKMHFVSGCAVDVPTEPRERR